MAEFLRRLTHTLASLSWPKFILLAFLALAIVVYATGTITMPRERSPAKASDPVVRLFESTKTAEATSAGTAEVDKKPEKARVKVNAAGRQVEEASRKLEAALERIEEMIERRVASAETRQDIAEENAERREDGRPQLPLPPEASAEGFAKEIAQALNVAVAEAIDRETAHYRLTANGLAIGLTISLLATLAVAKVMGGRRRVAEHEAASSRLEASCARLAKEVTEARLAMLQAQIEPHFLFNTLASVDHLITIDPAAASRMQKHLIQYLRASLPQMREASSTLAREAELARAYLSILRVRMEERLAFTFDIPAEVANLPFPPMMLPTLVENAIKHGLEPKPEGGRVEVKARREGAMLKVSVTDSGVGFAETPGKGLGLANIRERLALLFGDRAQLEILDQAPGTRVTLIIPIDGSEPVEQAAPCCTAQEGEAHACTPRRDCR